MEPKDFIAIGAAAIAITSLAMNIFWNRRTGARQQDQLRLSNRIEYQKLLFETDKMKVQNPHLALLFEGADPALRAADPVERARQDSQLDAYASYHISLFEVVYVFFRSHGGILTDEEREVYNAWIGWFDDLVKTSPTIRNLLLRVEAARVYNASFVEYAVPIARKYGPVGTPVD
jgi:hypothetical protein